MASAHVSGFKPFLVRLGTKAEGNPRCAAARLTADVHVEAAARSLSASLAISRTSPLAGKAHGAALQRSAFVVHANKYYKGRGRGRGRDDLPKRQQHIMNDKIRASEVRVLDNQKEMLGVMDLKEAKAKAREAKLDLVMISPDADPPVCRIMDYTKFRYESEKRNKEAKRNQKSLRVDIKELKMRYNIAENDFAVRVKAATRFLKAGDKVKFICQFRGRENQFKDIGREKFVDMAERLEEFGTIENQPRAVGSTMTMVIAPLVAKADLKAEKDAQKKKEGKAKKKMFDEDDVELPTDDTLVTIDNIMATDDNIMATADED